MSVSWAPSLQDVGDCIPTRTANTSLPGTDEYLGTFTADTRPTAAKVTNMIDKTVNDAILAVMDVTTVLEPAAANAVKWRVAADIELAYPERNADANVYAELDARAKYEWDLFLKAAASQNESTSSEIPVWYMPAPDPNGDRRDI